MGPHWGEYAAVFSWITWCGQVSRLKGVCDVTTATCGKTLLNKLNLFSSKTFANSSMRSTFLTVRHLHFGITCGRRVGFKVKTWLNCCRSFLAKRTYKAPSTRILINLKTDKYLYGYGFRPHVNGVFTHRKRINLKTLSRVDKFENAG